MSDYIQLIFQPVTSQQSEQLIAELNEIGFEGFEEADDCLKAFIPEGDFDEGKIKNIPGSEGLAYTKSVIKETNWNQVWESNFDPVVVDDFVAVRASFHEPVSSVEQEIMITLVVLTLFVPCFASQMILFKQGKALAAILIWIGSFAIAFSAGGLVSRLIL